jgi:hypothetical protein
MRTAMMQLRDRLQAKESSCTNYDAIQVYKSLINLITSELLEIEKQQHLDTYWAGLNGSINDYTDVKIVGNEMLNVKNGGGAEQYFNQTFNPK